MAVVEGDDSPGNRLVVSGLDGSLAAVTYNRDAGRVVGEAVNLKGLGVGGSVLDGDGRHIGWIEMCCWTSIISRNALMIVKYNPMFLRACVSGLESPDC